MRFTSTRSLAFNKGHDDHIIYNHQFQLSPFKAPSKGTSFIRISLATTNKSESRVVVCNKIKSGKLLDVYIIRYETYTYKK